MFFYTEALFLIIAVQADNQPHSDFNISDFNFGIKYGNLGRVIMLTVFEKFETVFNRVLFGGQVKVTLQQFHFLNRVVINMAPSLVFEFLLGDSPPILYIL